MAGAIVLVVLLIAAPVIVGIAASGLAALLGIVMQRDIEIEHEGSELIESNT